MLHPSISCLQLSHPLQLALSSSFSHSSSLTPPLTNLRSYVAKHALQRIAIATIGIKYGKYCGVGWSGCAGEKPCDDLDACCQIHDECVEDNGLMNIKCHEEFIKSIQEVKETGKVGFSESCPYEKAMPTMIQGMDMAILFSQFGQPKDEL